MPLDIPIAFRLNNHFRRLSLLLHPHPFWTSESHIAVLLSSSFYEMSRRNPQHIRRVSHSRRLLYIAAFILYRHFCRMVVKTYRLFLAGLEGLEPSTYGLRTTFRIRTETIIFIISKMTIMCSLMFFNWHLTISSPLLCHWATNPCCCFYKLYFRNSK